VRLIFFSLSDFFFVAGDYIYFTDWQLRSIEMVNKNNGTDRKVILDKMSDLMGLKAIDTRNPTGMYI
jgi:hypothetical protein